MKWILREIPELGMELGYFPLNMWNIIPLGTAVMVQYPKQWATFQICDVDLNLKSRVVTIFFQ